MKDVIIRNIERLLEASKESDREQIEPMSEWKWNEFYRLVTKFHLTPWINEGLKAYENDFFLQIPEALKRQIMTAEEEKKEENLERFRLFADRSISKLHHIKPDSLKAYTRDFIQTIANIEE